MPARPARLPAPDEIEAVLFDLDDTLVDARGSWRAGFAEAITELHARSPALQRLGPPTAIYDEHFRRYGEEAHRAAGFGEWQARFTVEAFERLVAEHLGPDADLAAQLLARYLAAVPGHLTLYPDAEPLLEQLGARYPLGLISNGPSELQRPKIEQFALDTPLRGGPRLRASSACASRTRRSSRPPSRRWASPRSAPSSSATTPPTTSRAHAPRGSRRSG